jgi:hypothetical protein
MTVKEVNHIRCFAIDIAKDLMLLSCRFSMERLCVLQLETACATLVTAWYAKAIESGFSRASEIIRNNLLALTYHPSLEKISGVVRHHSKEIEKGGTLAKLFPIPPV